MGEKITVTIWNLPCVACGGSGEVAGTVEGVPAACAAPGCEAAIREHVYTSEEWHDEDDDFREEYMRGGRGLYGVTCETCGGRRVVSVVDRRRLTLEQKKLFKLYRAQESERAREDYEDARTRRLESGGLY